MVWMMHLGCNVCLCLTVPRLKERVIECRKAHFENVWPPRDRNVGVILVAHSMGFVQHYIRM